MFPAAPRSPSRREPREGSLISGSQVHPLPEGSGVGIALSMPVTLLS